MVDTEERGMGSQVEKNDGSEEEKTSNEDHWPAVVSTAPSAFSISS